MKNEGGQRSWMCLREKVSEEEKKVFVNKQKLPLPLSHFTRDANFAPRRTSVPGRRRCSFGNNRKQCWRETLQTLASSLARLHVRRKQSDCTFGCVFKCQFWREFVLYHFYTKIFEY
jgi:hypothetical protein